MKTEQTTTTTYGVRLEHSVEVDVSPEILARVAAIVSTIQETQDDIDLLNALIADEKKKIMDLYKANGITSLRIDDVPVTLVTGGTSSSLDKKKFVLLGGNLQMLEDAKVTKPRRDYMLIGGEKTRPE